MTLSIFDELIFDGAVFDTADRNGKASREFQLGRPLRKYRREMLNVKSN